jgi:hypothetical protein
LAAAAVAAVVAAGVVVEAVETAGEMSRRIPREP